MLPKFTELLQGGPLLILLAFIAVCIAYSIINTVIDKEESRNNLADWVETQNFRDRYKQALSVPLDAMDRFWPRPFRPEDSALKNEVLRAWNKNLFLFWLAVALSYPILSLFFQWALGGTDAKVGGLAVFTAEPRLWLRLGVGAFMAAGCAVGVYFAMQNKLNQAGRWLFLIGCLPTLGAIYFFELDPRFMFLAAVAAAVAIAAAITIAISVALAVAFALAGSGSLFGALAGAAGGALVFYIGLTHSKMKRFSILGAILAYCLLFTALLHLHDYGTKKEVLAFFIFFSILPPLNAVFDFFSIGLTRWSLRRGLAAPRWRGSVSWAMVDLVMALVIFVSLGVATILCLHAYRLSDGSPIVDLAALFDDLSANPQHYWWLYVTFFSTLIPTLLHGSVALFALGGSISPEYAKTLTENIRRSGVNGVCEIKAKFGLIMMALIALILPFALLLGALWWIAGSLDEIGDLFFNLFRAMARAMGVL